MIRDLKEGNIMDRRGFLTKLSVVAAVPVLASVVGFNPLQHTTYNGELGSRLYVKFNNPKLGDKVKVFIPFRGQFRGIRGLDPGDSILSVSGERGILVTDQIVESESEIDISILDMPKNTKVLEGVIVMEKL